jgi:hypothetical protein
MVAVRYVLWFYNLNFTWRRKQNCLRKAFSTKSRAVVIVQYDGHLYRDFKIGINGDGFKWAVDLLLWNVPEFILIWQVFLVLIGT